MDITPLVKSLRSRQYIGGLVIGFAFVSGLGYILQRAVPDLASFFGFALVFTLTWLVLDNISVIR